MARSNKDAGDATARPSTKPGIHINDVRLKIEFFMGRRPMGQEAPIACAHEFPFRDRKSMSKWLGFTSDRLKDNDKSNQKNPRHSYTLSHEVIDTMARRLGFDANWPEWKTGNWEAFAKKYNTKNTYSAKEFDCQRDVNPASLDKSLGTVTLKIEANRVVLPARISVDLSCGEAPEGDMTIWIKKAQLRVTIGKLGLTVDVDHRKEFPADYPERKKDMQGCKLIAQGDDHSPYWDMESADACFGALTLREFVEVIDIGDGDDVVIELCVYVGDLIAIPNESRGKERHLREGDTQAMRWIIKGGDAVPQLSAKAAIAQRLAVKDRIEQLQGGSGQTPRSGVELRGELGTDRYLVLATHRLTFKSVPKGE